VNEENFCYLSPLPDSTIIIKVEIARRHISIEEEAIILEKLIHAEMFRLRREADTFRLITGHEAEVLTDQIAQLHKLEISINEALEYLRLSRPRRRAA
jgi:hypothetical protein